MQKLNNIFLVGPMVVGKTTVGRLLAKKLSMPFYDSDREIERRTGADISLIFEMEGEAGFRKRETKVLAELVQLANIVLATGGGGVMEAENRKNLSDNGFIIYLKATPEELYKRTAHDKRRPLLEGEDKLTQIKNILKQRESQYVSLANEIVHTDHLTIKKILDRVFNIIKRNEES